ncbi:uncharacterized protein V6R79_025361 [Siganus canaliculatus]
MSVTMAQSDGVTVFTLNIDPQSSLPPLCQILGRLCYSPVWCTTSQRIRKAQGTFQTVLGTLQIMVGLLNLGLAPILYASSNFYWLDPNRDMFPYWFGAVVISFGIVGILSEKYPSPCLVAFNLLLNVAAVGFAITAIVRYSQSIGVFRVDYYCNYDSSGYSTANPHSSFFKEKCLEGKRLTLMMMKSFIAVLIVLSVLELCFVVSSAILTIKALKRSKTDKDKSTGAGRMSVTMTRADGVTVFTLKANPNSLCPPLCQVLGGFCYSPLCCSASQRLRTVQDTSQTVLGTLHIMVGFLSMGLAAILYCSGLGSSWQMDETMFPFWTGAVFILCGIVGILSEKFPSPCLVIFNVMLNVAGVGFAIAAIVLYCINLAYIRAWWMCRDYDDDDYYYRRHRTVSPRETIIKEMCQEGNDLAVVMLRSINAVLIVLSVLELAVTISSAVMAIKNLRRGLKGENKSVDDPLSNKALLEDVATD